MKSKSQKQLNIAPRAHERLCHNIAFEMDSDTYFLGAGKSFIKEGSPVSEAKNFLGEKKFSKRDLPDITYRTIHHWSQEGLLDKELRQSGANWRKFSITDLLWIHILHELRLFGFGIDQFKKTHSSAYYLGGDKASPRQTLEYAIYLCALNKPVFAVVFNDGWFELVSKDDLDWNIEHRILKDIAYIALNINHCLEHCINSIKSVPFSLNVQADFSKAPALTDTEQEVLEKLRSGKYTKIEIRSQDGKITRVSGTKSTQIAPDNLLKMIKAVNYGEITVKIEHGALVFTEIKEHAKVS